MTVTETDAPAAEAGHAPSLAPPRPATGLASVLGSADHKTIGRLWIVTSFIYLLVAGVVGAGFGVEKLDVADISVLDADVFAQAYSLHAIAGTFLFLLPLLIGIATVVVPLQVGSRSIAFPRAAAAAYWTYLVAGGVTVASFVIDGGPFGRDADAVDLFVASFAGVVVALVLASVTIATTGIALRAPGMSLRRTPLFTWANIVQSVLIVLTLPVLVGLLVLVYVDLRYGQTFLGGSEGIFTRIAWAWSQPSVYVFAIPALGVIGDVVPVAARTRITLHKVAMGAIGAFGLFSFGAWAIPGFGLTSEANDLAYVNEVPFYAFSALVVLPVLVLVGLVADTLRRGSIKLTSPLIWSVAALLLVLKGTAVGLAVSIDPFELVGTSAQSAQTHAIVGATVLAGFGALVHWAPKVFGSSMPETPSKLLAAGGLLGVALLSAPDLVSGFLDQGARLSSVPSDTGAIEALNAASLGGGALLLLVAVGFLGLVLQTASSSTPATDDPWEGHTLEWATSSPPSVDNFSQVPAVTSEAPLYDLRHGHKEEA